MTSKAVVGDLTCNGIYVSFPVGVVKTIITSTYATDNPVQAFAISSDSTYCGHNAGNKTNLTNGGSMTLFGARAGEQLTTGINDTLMGWGAGSLYNGASYCTAVGMMANRTNISGNNNVCVGYSAGYKHVGSDNVCIGYQAGSGTATVSDVTTSAMTSIGSNSIASGDNCISIGYNSNAAAANVIALGSGAGATVTDGIAIGLNSSSSASAAICVGSGSAASATDGIAIGKNSLASAASSIAIGSGVTSSTASRITIGTGSQHVYIGGSIRSNTTGNGLTIVQDTPGSAWMTMQASFSGGPSIITIPRATSTASTTGATAQTVAIGTSQIQWIEVKALGKRTGGTAGTVSDSAYFRVTGLYYNNAGTVSLIGTLVKEYIPATTGWSVDQVISGTNVNVTVTGILNVNIDWQVVTSTWSMG